LVNYSQFTLAAPGRIGRGFCRSYRNPRQPVEGQVLAHRIVENLQGQNLTLEEAAPLTKLIHKGATLDDVAARTGLSQTTIKRRLALNGLCDEASAALALGTINLSQAEALTPWEAQRSILEEIERGSGFSGDDIKTSLLDDRPTMASAIFPLEHYTGTITTDPFAEDETAYLNDGEAFLRLQKEAVTQLVRHHEACAAWVELTKPTASSTGTIARPRRASKAVP
jgi:ParB family transcriptional regulator, chromosome partitioning protein